MTTKRLFKNATIYVVGDVAIKLTTVFLLPIFTVLLTPQEYGMWALGTMMLTGLTFFYNPALNGAVNRWFYDHDDDETALRRFQGTIATFLLVWSAFLSVVLFVVGPDLFAAVVPELPFDPYGSLIIWMAFLSVLQVIPMATWLAGEKPKAFVAASMLSTAVNLFGAIGFVVLGGVGVIGLFWAKLLSLMVVGIPYARHLGRHVGFAWHVPDLVGAMRFSLPLVPHLMAHWVLSASDRLIIDWKLSTAAVGIYSVAYAFTDAVTTVASSMSRAWVPIFMRSYDDEAEHKSIAQSITYFLLTVGVTSVSVAVLSPSVVRTFFDARYAEAAEFAPVLALGGLFLGLYLVYVTGLFYYKRNSLVPVITITCGLINIGLNILWIPSMGLYGAALATLVGYVALALGMRWGCRRFTRLPMERDRLARLFVVGALVTTVGLLVDGHFPPLVEWLAKLLVLVSGPLILHALGFWKPHERAWLRGKWTALLTRLRVR